MSSSVSRGRGGRNGEAARSVSMAAMRRLRPFEGLRTDSIKAILERAEVHRVAAGKWLFKEGDEDDRSYFLLDGEVGLYADGRRVRLLAQETAEARTELVPVKPRRLGARVEKPATVLVLESELLALMLSWDKTGSYEVAEFAEEEPSAGAGDDWMTTLLQSNLFQFIPPGNIQAIFLRLERRPVSAGDVVIRQGEYGDYFYFLIEGTAVVCRESPHGTDGTFKLARLGKGDTFGEEALLSGRERTASVVMETDGAVMRLSQEDFRTLLCEPMLEYVTMEQAKRIVASGGRWLDVRLPNEQQQPPPGDWVGIPLFMLRMKHRTLDPAQPLVVVCNDGGRAAAAAYLLVARGHRAMVVEGGMGRA